MGELSAIYEERRSEIDAYFSLLEALERQLESGPPRLGEDGPVITATQLRIMYSNVFILLYNLVEAIVNKCSIVLCAAITQEEKWFPGDLSDQLKTEWVLGYIKNDPQLSHKNRIKKSMEMFDHLVSSLPIRYMSIVKSNGGNWDDVEISKFSRKVGCKLIVRESSRRAVSRHFVDDHGALKYVVVCRNKLAHGELSFAECGTDFTVSRLHELRNAIIEYMLDIVKSFENFIDNHSFLDEKKRDELLLR